MKLSRAQDQGLQFRQTKSFAIVTHDTVPGDCIHRVISQNGDREKFEILATPRPAPKDTLKSNWLVQPQQQQRQVILKEGVNSISKEAATWESRAGMRDETINATEVDMASGNSKRTALKKWTLVVATQTHSRQTKRTQEIERVKIVLNKICIREDLAKYGVQ